MSAITLINKDYAYCNIEDLTLCHEGELNFALDFSE